MGGRFVLRNFVSEVGGCERGQKFILFRVIANIDIALIDVAGSSSVDVGCGEGGRGARQGGRGDERARLNWSHSNRRREVTRLVGGRPNLLLLRMVTRGTERDPCRQ